MGWYEGRSIKNKKEEEKQGGGKRQIEMPWSSMSAGV